MRHFAPRRLFAYSFLWWGVLTLLAPFSYTIKPTTGGVILLVLYAGFFIAGTFFYDLYDRLRRGEVSESERTTNIATLSGQAIRTVWWAVAVLAIAGLVLRFYDLVVVKNYLTFESSTDFKLNYDAAEVGAVSIVSALLMPFAMVLPLLGRYYKKELSRFQRLIGWLCFIGLATYFVMRGGRTSLTLMLVMFIAAAVLGSKTGKLHLSKRAWLIGGVIGTVGLLFFVYSLAILVERLDRMGFSVVSGLDYMEGEHHLNIDDRVMEWAEQGEMAAGLTYTAVSLEHYFLHGYHQFFLLRETFDSRNRTWGAAQFYPAAKFLGAMGFKTWTADELEDILQEPAVYYTFFGPVYMDFGYWGLLYCLLLGLIVQMSFKRATRGDALHRLVYPYAAAVILHSSYLNMIQSGSGLYFLLALLVSGLALRIAGVFGFASLSAWNPHASWGAAAIPRK